MVLISDKVMVKYKMLLGDKIAVKDTDPCCERIIGQRKSATQRCLNNWHACWKSSCWHLGPHCTTSCFFFFSCCCVLFDSAKLQRSKNGSTRSNVRMPTIVATLGGKARVRLVPAQSQPLLSCALRSSENRWRWLSFWQSK